ncbi:hypothetical protein IWW36_000298 [Coemansia brasiliensis]|uniref:VASt domain-containing protein n=1 Tax=Coemansia brasiliensis TaxID=2650707 RepID=A0A9W8M1X9_9FUNG|nr:hypothetical protein IWW36_000298 [Coemansia brasiliensis]
MTREEKPRGLRARLRQRRARNGSEDETRSRPTSLDLGRSTEPAMLRAGMQSLTAVPTRADNYYNDSIDNNMGGLALGEFAEEGGEVAEDEEGIDAAVISPESVASDSQRESAVRRARRESWQSMPDYGTRGTVQEANGAEIPATPSERSGSEEDSASSEFSSDEESAADELDADSELNAVYLRRNADFHALFRNIPINELLIDDYGCALQRDILVQGRLYLTENFVCFYSNIFGWVTSLVIAFDEIVSIEKRMTALIIPNAIQVSTLHAKHFFGSFIYRDSAYNQLYDLWVKSRSEKTAGVPETGRAEDGAGAGDVSRHRADIVNHGYQSLSEDDDTHSQRSLDLSPRQVPDSGSESNVIGKDKAYASSMSGSESDDSWSSSMTNEKHPAKRLSDNSKNSTAAAAPSSVNGVLQHSRLDAGSDASISREVPGDITPSTATDASSIMPQTAPDSTVNSTANVSRIGSQMLTSALPVAQTNGIAAAPAKAVAGQSKRLLAKLPKTPDGTDTGSRESLLVDSPQSSQRIEPPSLHKPTECPCGSSGHTAHYSLEALDATFPLALPLLFRVVFSASVPASLEKMYMSGVSGEELASSCTRRIAACGNTDVRTEGWVPDPDDSAREMCIYTYEKPLGFSIGPKSTMVEDTFRITMKDFDKAVIVEQVVKTPNVPSGTAFFIKVRHCLTWAAGPSNYPRGGWSRYRMTFQVEWVKTSWIKSTIEKGSMDSNKQAGEQLEKYIREWIAAHPDKEVKAGEYLLDAQNAGTGEIASDAASASVAHKRRRRKHGRKRREFSPHGLRMEEVLGSGSDIRKRASDGVADDGNNVGRQQANSEKQAGAISAVAKDKATGALLASAESDLGKLNRILNLAGPTAIIAGAVVVLLLGIVPAVINLWRLNGSVAMNGQYMEPKYMEQISQLQSSIDAIASQMAEINQNLQMLLERQGRP